MKLILLIIGCSLLNISVIYAQYYGLPIPPTRRVPSDTVYNYVKKNYDYTIMLSVESGWQIGSDDIISALSKKDEKWFYLKIYQPFKDRKTIRLFEKQRVRKSSVKLLMDSLTKLKFWSLSIDSLDMDKMEPKIQKEARNYFHADTMHIQAYATRRRLDVVDGAAYYIQIIEGNQSKLYHSYAPDSYLKVYPKNQTLKYSVNSLKLIQDFFNKN